MLKSLPSLLLLLVSLGPPVTHADGPEPGGGQSELLRTAQAHASDEPVASPLAVAEPAQRVNSRPAIYLNVDGESVEGWLAWPATADPGEFPGVIVIHEWWGLNDNIRSTAERLAGEGYVALAVDLYRGESADTPKDALKLSQSLSDATGAALNNLEAANRYLRNVIGADRVGVVGWCLGGKWSLRAALHMPRNIDAMVMYYGAVETDRARLATLDMPVLGHFASTDPIVPADTVEAFAVGLAELGKNAQVFVYPDTKHAFSNPSGLAYNPVAADLAWQRTTYFFNQHLK